MRSQLPCRADIAESEYLCGCTIGGLRGDGRAYTRRKVTAAKMEVLGRADADESSCVYCGDVVGFCYHGALCPSHFSKKKFLTNQPGF